MGREYVDHDDLPFAHGMVFWPDLFIQQIGLPYLG